MKKLKFLLLACVAAGSFLAANTEAADSSNSVVRFRISYGPTRFGDVDIELFDQDKPITVSNFLYQVQNDSFDRTFLHRVVPGYIVQGGLYSVDNPYTQELFTEMTRIPEGPAITNEFFVGPRVENTYGTLAMALSSDTNGLSLPDSGTTSWFFNLADNTTAHKTNYVAFGRLKAGAKTLNFFNTLVEDEGIINMFGLTYVFSPCDYPFLISQGEDVALDSLPVAYFFFDCPYYSDLFNVQISMISGKDVAPPKITIAPIGIKQVISNSTFTVTGTVTDNMAVELVRVYLGAGSPVTAALNTNNHTWSLTISNVPPGYNSILVEATDPSGNRSNKGVTFFHSYAVPIGVFATSLNGLGTGTILGPTNGQLLEIGLTYTLTAKPDRGNLFAGWTDGNPSPTYTFTMVSNLNLTAVFNTNYFPYVKGTYTGVFCDTNRVEEQSSGFLTLTVGDLGTYSAKMTIEGKTYPFSGTFNSAYGTDVNFVIRNFSNDITVRLNLDLLFGSDHLTGTNTTFYTYSVSETNLGVVTTTFYTNQWTAELHADRAVFGSAMPAPLAGKYTLIIPADSNSPAGPFGDGYGTATISTKGSLSFSGSLPDGTKVSQKVPVSKNGDWPLYLNLYKGKGTLLSRILFDTNQPTTDLSGLMNWFKRTQVTKYYGGGFTNESMIIGSRFTPPTATTPLLHLTTAVVGFTNGNLAADFANDVTLDATGKVTNQDPNKLSVSLSKSSGLMSGSATPPAPGSKSISFKGAMLQKQTNAFGFFLGTNATGRVSLGQ